MKIFFNIRTLFLAVFIFCSCNFFSAEILSNHGQPIKEVETKIISVTANCTVNIDNSQSIPPLWVRGIVLNSILIIDHSQWDKLLKKHVDKNGFVDYAGFKKDVAALDVYLNILSEKQPSEDWSKEELLAYYINLYNAATVRLIVGNYPIKSIKDINRPWTKEIVYIGNKKFSLNGIEHGILRKMNEPRIHFALNCASISCPKLSNEAYSAGKINEQLERATKEFINSDKNNISASNPKISSLFDWYRKDFKVNGKTDVIAFINQYSSVKINPKANISYMKYDWDLNEGE